MELNKHYQSSHNSGPPQLNRNQRFYRLPTAEAEESEQTEESQRTSTNHQINGLNGSSPLTAVNSPVQQTSQTQPTNPQHPNQELLHIGITLGMKINIAEDFISKPDRLNLLCHLDALSIYPWFFDTLLQFLNQIPMAVFEWLATRSQFGLIGQLMTSESLYVPFCHLYRFGSINNLESCKALADNYFNTNRCSDSYLELLDTPSIHECHPYQLFNNTHLFGCSCNSDRTDIRCNCLNCGQPLSNNSCQPIANKTQLQDTFNFQTLSTSQTPQNQPPANDQSWPAFGNSNNSNLQSMQNYSGESHFRYFSNVNDLLSNAAVHGAAKEEGISHQTDSESHQCTTERIDLLNQNGKPADIGKNSENSDDSFTIYVPPKLETKKQDSIDLLSLDMKFKKISIDGKESEVDKGHIAITDDSSTNEPNKLNGNNGDSIDSKHLAGKVGDEFIKVLIDESESDHISLNVNDNQLSNTAVKEEDIPHQIDSESHQCTTERLDLLNQNGKQADIGKNSENSDDSFTIYVPPKLETKKQEFIDLQNLDTEKEESIDLKNLDMKFKKISIERTTKTGMKVWDQLKLRANTDVVQCLFNGSSQFKDCDEFDLFVHRDGHYWKDMVENSIRYCHLNRVCWLQIEVSFTDLHPGFYQPSLQIRRNSSIKFDAIISVEISDAGEVEVVNNEAVQWRDGANTWHDYCTRHIEVKNKNQVVRISIRDNGGHWIYGLDIKSAGLIEVPIDYYDKIDGWSTKTNTAYITLTDSPKYEDSMQFVADNTPVAVPSATNFNDADAQQILNVSRGTKRLKTKKVELRGHPGEYINFNAISKIQTDSDENICETKYVHSSYLTSNYKHVSKETCGSHIAYNGTGLAAGKADSGNFPMVHSDRPPDHLREELWITLKDEHVITTIEFEPRAGFEYRLIGVEVIIRTADGNAISSAHIGADYKVVFPPVFV